MGGATADETQTATLGILLRRFRRAAGLTQEALAEGAQVSARCIRDIELGSPHQPRKDTLRLLAAALSLSPDEEALFLAAARTLRLAPDDPTHPPCDAASHNFPLPPTPLIGRAQDVAALSQLLQQDDVRLVTISGVGGVGKTHLALALARQMRATFPGGVSAIDLAAVPTADLVLTTIAEALGVREQGATSLRALLRRQLDVSPCLLVLDNFEHLLPAALSIVDLLADCPPLKMLVTSRTALHVRGEHVYVLQPLALPSCGESVTVEQVAAAAAVELFLARIHACRPEFTLTPDNASTVGAICCRLDGLPLALELAAPHLLVLAPEAVLERLHAPLGLLTAGAHDLPLRQRTLRATIAWSYDLLPSTASVVLRRLAVFPRSAGWEAAAALCGVGDEDDLLEALEVLARHNLIMLSTSAGERRISLLETLRSFGREQLLAHGEWQELETTHARFYAQLAETVESHLATAEQADWLARLDQEMDNVRAALAWAIEQRDTVLAARIAGALWPYWNTRGLLTEARHWLDAAVALLGMDAEAESSPKALETVAGRTGEDDASAVLKVLQAAGVVAMLQSEYAVARTRNQAYLALGQRIGDVHQVASALNQLGTIAVLHGEFDEALRCNEQSVELQRQWGTQHEIACALTNLAIVYTRQGALERALDGFEECLQLRRAIGTPQGIAQALNNLAHCASRIGQLDRAREAIRESLSLYEQVGNRRGLALALMTRADVACADGAYAESLTHYRHAAQMLYVMGMPHYVAECMDAVATIAGRLKKPSVAARLLLVADAVRAEHGMSRSADEQRAYDACMRHVEASLSPPALAELRQSRPKQEPAQLLEMEIAHLLEAV